MGRTGHLEALVVFEKWMQTTRDFLQLSASFPKRFRSSLTARMENLFLDVAELLTTAAYTRNRGALFERLDDSLNRLRVMIRLCHEVAVISDAQYHSLAQALTETGRMIGGWKKAGGAGSAVRGDRSVDQSSLKPVEP